MNEKERERNVEEPKEKNESEQENKENAIEVLNEGEQLKLLSEKITSQIEEIVGYLK